MDNLNKLWSDILAYKPIYNKNEKNDVISSVNDNNKNNLSKCVESYLANSPYKVINTINDSIYNLELSLKQLESNIKNIFPEFIDNITDKKYILSVITDNSDILGSSIYEIYYMLYNDYNSLKEFKKDYIINNFGNVKEEDIEKMSEQTEKIIINNEIENNFKNNYLNLAFDSYANSVINSYLYNINAINNKIIINGTFKTKQSISSNIDNVKYLVKNAFNENIDSTVNAYFQCNSYIENNNIKKAYNQCCNLRSDMNKAINAFNDNNFKNSTSSCISAINDIKKNTINTAFKSLEELTKSIMLGNAYKKNYINKLIITENYKNIYNS